MNVDHWTMGEIWSADVPIAGPYGPASHQMAFEALLWPEGQLECWRAQEIQQCHMTNSWDIMNFLDSASLSHLMHHTSAQLLAKFDTVSTGKTVEHNTGYHWFT